MDQLIQKLVSKLLVENDHNTVLLEVDMPHNEFSLMPLQDPISFNLTNVTSFIRDFVRKGLNSVIVCIDEAGLTMFTNERQMQGF